jgi:hypothetical protein
MNSLDAVFSAAFLLLGFGMLLGAVTGQETLAESAGGAVEARGKALFCASAADSAGANSLESPAGGDGCFVGGKKIVFEGSGKRKETGFLDFNFVEEHYATGSNIFD